MPNTPPNNSMMVLPDAEQSLAADGAIACFSTRWLVKYVITQLGFTNSSRPETFYRPHPFAWVYSELDVNGLSCKDD
jgi:hypothetical protein